MYKYVGIKSHIFNSTKYPSYKYIFLAFMIKKLLKIWVKIEKCRILNVIRPAAYMDAYY